MSQSAKESNNVEGVELNGMAIDLEHEDDRQDARGSQTVTMTRWAWGQLGLNLGPTIQTLCLNRV